MCFFSKRAFPEAIICQRNETIGSASGGLGSALSEHSAMVAGFTSRGRPDKKVGEALIDELTDLFKKDPLLSEFAGLIRLIPTVAMPVSPTWQPILGVNHTLVLAGGQLKLLVESYDFENAQSDINRLKKVDLANASLEGLTAERVKMYCGLAIPDWRRRVIGPGQLLSAN